MASAHQRALERASARLRGLERSTKIRTPSLWLDALAIEHNIDAMIARVGEARRWRPHIKTHKCSEVLKICLDRGVRFFKCATLTELELVLQVALSRDVKVDVCCAYPFYEEQWHDAQRIEQANEKAGVSWLVDSPEHLGVLCKAGNRSSKLRLALDVDTGMGRSGTPVDIWIRRLDDPELREALRSCSIEILHGYEGHLSWNEKEEAARGYEALLELRDFCVGLGADPELLTSGTHSYPHALEHGRLASLGEKAKVSPGTVVLHDLNSVPAGEDLGLHYGAFVASRVLSARAGRVTLDAGSKAISPDIHQNLATILGHPEWSSRMQHEEHLVMQGPNEAQPFELGQIVWLVPAHVCTTVNLYGHANWLDSQSSVSTVPIVRGHAWAEAMLRGSLE